MRKKALAATLLALCSAAAQNAYAFDGFSDASGSHMESLRSCLCALFGIQASVPVLAKKMPASGAGTFRWESYGPVELLSDASRDFDSYYSGMPCAHAKTADFDYGKKRSPESLKALEAEALLDYVKHMGKWVARVRALFIQGKDYDAAYLLGAVCHSYQDLWANRGVTDAMRKTLLKRSGLDLDRDQGREAEMAERLSAWMAAMPELLGPEAGPAYLDFMTSGQALKIPADAQRKKLLKRDRDIDVQGPLSALFVRSSEKSLNYLDAVSWDAESLDSLLSDAQSLEQAAALKSPGELVAFLEGRGYRF